MIKTYIEKLGVFIILILVLSSCDLERLESAQATADGGGTVDTFTAYTINSTDPMGSNVYGRIVFWKTDLDQTLVQVSLYNTIASSDPDNDPNLYSVEVFDGVSGIGTSTMMTLNSVKGSTGEFTPDKFFLISDTSFYDLLEGSEDDEIVASFDAHINVFDLDGTTIIATGDIGVNADPVDSN